MPIYIYKEIKTGKIHEVIQNINDKPLKEINGKKVVKIPASSSFILKGGGWHKTDYQ